MQGIRYKDFPQFLQEWLTVVSWYRKVRSSSTSHSQA
jgi:hypothetical protein